MIFSKANTKLKKLAKSKLGQKILKGRKIYSFDLLSGYSCPFAKDCKTRVIKTKNGFKIKDSSSKFRCYAASTEVLFPKVYNKRKVNYSLVKSLSQKQIVQLLLRHLPKNAGIIRIHTSGDFFKKSYFLAWVEVAKSHPEILFYAYTKAIKYWRDSLSIIPSNLILTASYGGKQDNLIGDLKSVRVVYSKYKAKKLRLPLSIDDTHAILNKSFAILIHGTQPKGKLARIICKYRRQNVKSR